MSNLKTPLLSAFFGLSLLASGGALAGESLNCPAGTRQAGSAATGTGIVSCVDSAGMSQGPYMAFDDAGNLVARGTMKDSKREGTTTFFDADGQKVAETDFRQSRYHGKRITYFANGAVKSELSYRDGRLDGEALKYNAKGQLVRAASYEAGRRVASR